MLSKPASSGLVHVHFQPMHITVRELERWTKEIYSEMGNQMEDQEGDDYVPNEPQATDMRREELASSESYANVKPVKDDLDERYRFEADDWGDHW